MSLPSRGGGRARRAPTGRPQEEEYKVPWESASVKRVEIHLLQIRERALRRLSSRERFDKEHDKYCHFCQVGPVSLPER